MMFKKSFLAVSLIVSFFLQAQDTYTIGTTEYYYNQTYSTTGKPKVKRSQANKTAFLRSRNLTETPEGYEIDHIIPLSQGGTDDPGNMQLLTVRQHKAKTAIERSARSSSSSYFPSYNYSTSSSYNYNRTPSYSNSSSTQSRTYYTGSRGGTFYYNSSGNKVYTKSKTARSNSTTSSRSTYNYSTPTSSSSRTIHTGSRGGKYYINSNGNKTYVKSKG